MNLQKIYLSILYLIIAFTACCQTTAFSYQGQISSGGSAINSSTVIRFKLYDAFTAGSQIGSSIDVTTTPVNGLFTTQLDFGSTAFSGARRWLEISIITNSGATVTTLTPRQEITPAPYAINAQTLSLPLTQTANNSSNLFTIHNSGSGNGMLAQSDSGNGIEALSSGSNAAGVYAHTTHQYGYAGYFSAESTIGNAYGIYSDTKSSTGYAIEGLQLNPTNTGTAIYGINNSPNGYAVVGSNSSATGWAGYFYGRTYLQGNVGFSNISPGFPITLANTLGDKISLYGSSGNHYGFGVQSTLLQIHSDNSASDIAFGYGSSSSFTEAMRIKGSGNVGIGTTTPVDRLDIRNGLVRMSNTVTGTGSILMGVGLPSYPVLSGAFGSLNSGGSYQAYIGATSVSPGYGGTVIIFDNNGAQKATMSVNSAGQGVVSANLKNFREPNPRVSGTDIVYACIEGPEAAAYIRGTGTLRNGKAVINFPEHFQDVAELEGMTVQLTACSADSKGLAVVEQMYDHISIQELLGGKGNYQFHWRIEAVRKGYKDYQVIQPSFPIMRDDRGK